MPCNLWAEVHCETSETKSVSATCVSLPKCCFILTVKFALIAEVKVCLAGIAKLTVVAVPAKKGNGKLGLSLYGCILIVSKPCSSIALSVVK